MLPVSLKLTYFLQRLLKHLPCSLLLIGGISLAATPASSPAPTTDSVNKNKMTASPDTFLPGALFRIEKNHRTAWLYGTIHVGQPDLLNKTALLRKTLDQAQGLVMESETGTGANPQADAALAAEISKTGSYPPGHSARDDLPPKTLLDLTSLFRGDQQALDKTLQSRIWLTALVMEVQILESIGLEAKDGVEKQLYAEIKSRGKPVFGLEDGVKSMHLFSDAPVPVQSMMLQTTLDELAKPFYKTDMAALLKDWREGNLEQLWHDATRHENDGNDAYRDYVRNVLILRRNRTFAEGIDKLVVAQPDLFIAVGMLHLAGPDSVITLLKKRGYKITRILPPKAEAPARAENKAKAETESEAESGVESGVGKTTAGAVH